MTNDPLSHSRRLSRRLTLLAATPLALAGLFVVAVTTVHAAPAMSADDALPTITLHHVDRAPATPAEARRLYHRVVKAAVEVCGGGDFSLMEFDRAIRDSQCFHKAMHNAFAQVDSSRLSVALAENWKP